MAKYVIDDTTMTGIADAIREKEGSTGAIPTSQMKERIRAIETGTQLPELTNPASEAEIFSGKEVIDATGAKKTGTFTLEGELATQEDLISQIDAALTAKGV